MELTPFQRRALEASPVAHLATAGASGTPHVIPICFVWGDGALYSALDQKPKRAALTRLRRVRNIVENPQVALVIDHYEQDWSKLWYVLVSGRAELLEDGRERVEAIGLLRKKYPQYLDMDIDDNPVIKITPERIVSWSGAGETG